MLLGHSSALLHSDHHQAIITQNQMPKDSRALTPDPSSFVAEKISILLSQGGSLPGRADSSFGQSEAGNQISHSVPRVLRPGLTRGLFKNIMKIISNVSRCLHPTG